ncbi:MAG: hypothetical protein JWQ03_597 [Variovorax sp.]|nr:hypothetical protein [Variovorax sp.]
MADNFWEQDTPASKDAFWEDDQPAAKTELPEGVKASTAGAGRGGRDDPRRLDRAAPPAPPAGPRAPLELEVTATGSTPASTNTTASVTRTRSGGSIVENTPGGFPVPEPRLTERQVQENARLSSRRTAETTPQITDAPRPQVSEGKFRPQDSAVEGLGLEVGDSNPLVRIAGKAVGQGAEALGGVVRAAGDLTGAGSVARFGANAAKNASQFQESMGKARVGADVFNPAGPAGYLADQAENAGASLANSYGLARAFGAKAVIPLMSLQDAGSYYNEARNAGKDPLTALALAVPHGTFEAVGEKFTGTAKAMDALRVMMSRGAPKKALQDAGAVLMEAGVKEIPGEWITYLGQTALDVMPGVGIKPNMTTGEFVQGLIDTTVQAAMMGGMVGGGGAIATARAGGGARPQKTPEMLAREKGFLVQEEQVKRLNAAGEKEVARGMQQQVDSQRAETELEALADKPWAQDEGFQQRYRQLRTEGKKPAEAAARSAMSSAYAHIGELVGLHPKAFQKATELAATMPMEKVPGFFERFTANLVKKGMAGTVPGGTIDGAVAGVRDDAVQSTLAGVYGEDPNPAAAGILELEGSNAGTAGGHEEPGAAAGAGDGHDSVGGGAGATVGGPAQGGEPAAPADTTGAVAPPAGQAAGDGQQDAPTVARAGRSPLHDEDLTPNEHGAHQAAASPLNDKPEPTKAQILAGNATMGHMKVGGLGVTVENPADSVREDKHNEPPKWRTPMQHGYHYGYIKRTEAADSTEAKRQGIDVFVKEGTPEDYAGPVFVVDQVSAPGKFDEHKALIGPGSEAEARADYLKHYSPGWQGLGAITEMSMPDFKKWVREGKKADPAGQLDAPDAPDAAPASAPAAAAEAPPPVAPLRLGKMPTNAEPVTVHGGVVHIGRYEAVDFDSGEPVTVPEGATDAQIKAALQKAGAIAKGAKFFGGAKDPAQNPAAPNTPQSAPSAQAPSAATTGGKADNPRPDGKPAETAPNEASPSQVWNGTPPPQREAFVLEAGWKKGSPKTKELLQLTWRELTAVQKEKVAAAITKLAKVPAPTVDAPLDTPAEQSAEQRHADARAIGRSAGERGDPRDPPVAFTSTQKQLWRAGWDDSKRTKVTPQVPPVGATAAPASKPKKQTKAEAEQQAFRARLADYFQPGAIVKSYYGHDRVLALELDAPHGWRVQVVSVIKKDGEWIDAPKEQPRWHSTTPDPKAQPVVRPAPAAATPAPTSAPTVTMDKAEIRPYRKPDGSVGYEAVPIEAPASAPLPVAAPAAARPSPPAPAAVDKPAPVVSANKVFTDDAAAAARARLKAKLGRLNSGLDPETMLDGITLAGYHIEKGARTFAAYAQAMLGDLGDAVRPYLKSWYMGVKYDPRSAAFSGEMSTGAFVEEFDVAAIATPAGPSEAPEVETEAQPAHTGATDDSTPATEPPADDRQLAPIEPRPGSGETAVRRGAAAQDAQPGRADDGGVRQPDQPDAVADDGAQRLGDGGSDGGVPDQGAGNLERSRERLLAGDYRAPAGSLTREGSWLTTARRNVDLIELALKIEAEKRPATTEEQAQLAKYVGFGASEIRNKLFPVPHQYARQQEPDRLIWPNLVYEASWKQLAERMDKLPREWQKSVLQSTQYAHYTSEGIVRATWAAVQRLGFTGGKILEPGVGTGNFAMAMPESMRRPKGYTGIEMDGPTALIARLLSPAQNMLHEDFIKRKLPRDFFDLAIGNPPFSQTKILGDPDYEKFGFMLHDFFFAKTIDRVRPGGLLVFVTSKGTMDKQTDRARKYLADRADLLGAIRLPSTAFEANAGTSVVADVLFLRKREAGAEPAGHKWTDVATVETKDGPVVINEYFAANPAMVLGQNRISGGQDDEGRRINSNGRGGEKYTVVSYDKTPEELDAKFAEAVKLLPENVYSTLKASAARVKEETRRVDYDPKVKREGVVYIDGKQLMRVESGVGRELQLSEKDAQWMRSYVGLRDLVQTARQLQADDGTWEPALAALNKAYDAFVKKHGPINDFRTMTRKTTDEDGNPVETTIRVFKNKRLLREDYDHALMISLEHIDEAGKIKKAPFLRGRTIGKPQPREVKTVGDALAVSLDEIGRLDLEDVAQRLRITKDEAIEALGTNVYKAPSGEWQLSDEYLSGDVVAKLEEAQTAAAIDPSLERNIEALKAVQPDRLGPSQISVKLGASWVPAEYVSEFAAEIGAGAVSFDAKTETWQVQGGNERSARRAGAEYGTAARSPAELLEAALNSRQVVIKTKDADKKEITDAEATTAANEMLRKIKDKFKGWVWGDTERAATLVETYNRRFNNIAPRRFDGSHLTLPGVSLRFKLHPHQLRAIWRQIQTGNTYLAHAVGAGKTIEMIAGGMEQKRLGLIKKPIYVVPNHMLEQFSNEFMELYPLANIMVADDENFSAERRKAFIAAATLNGPDAIVITHSAFERVGVKEESVAPIRDEILADLESELDDVGKSDRVRRSQLEQQIEAVTQRFDSIVGMGKKDNVVAFEDMGVDFVYADEAHAYRKLDFTTNQKIKGIDPSGSRRALDMYVKTRVLNKRQPGRAFVFASGTAVTNTMGELYTLMRFYVPEEMDRTGIASFDSWARQFGEVGIALEANAAGRYENVTRFSKFDNVPELMSRVRQFMDVLTSEHLGSLVKRPDLEGGKPNLVMVEATKALKSYMKTELSPRIEVSRAWKPSFEQPFNPDPMLAIISDGRFAALDPRFFGGKPAEGETTKLDEMADRVVKTYHATADNVYVDKDTGKDEPVKGGTQLVFFNLGFGAASMANRGFDARAHFTKRLTAGGVKRDQILWFDDANTDAKKEAMFQAMRDGRARILIGSAKKMGTGVNVQKRLIRLHYFDPPWYPADVEQPHGRIIRQGNQNLLVGIDWYATKGAYDSTMWQMVARKQRFIDQAFSGDKNLRSMEDMSEASQYEQAAAMASGDPRAIQLAGYKQDIERLERLQAAHANEQIAARDGLRSARWNIDSAQKRIKALEAAQKALGGNYFQFTSGTVGERGYDKLGEFGQALKDLFNKASKKAAQDECQSERAIPLGKMGPVQVVGYPAYYGTKDPEFKGVELFAVVGEEKVHLLTATELGADADPVGLGRRVVNAANSISRDLDTERKRLTDNEADERRLNKKLGVPFEHQQDMLEKNAALKQLEDELRAEGEAEAAAQKAHTTAAKPVVIKEDGSDGAPSGDEGGQFARGDVLPSGLTIEEARAVLHRMRGAGVEAVQQAVDELAADWKDRPPIKVVASYRDLPGGGKPGDRGMHMGGRIWIVADGHRASMDLTQRVGKTLAHEAVAHYGLRQMLGDDFDRLLTNPMRLATASGNKAMIKLRDWVREHYKNGDGSYTLTARDEVEEMAARAVEQAVDADGRFRPGFGWLKAMWASVRQFLRSIWPKLEFTDAELHGMLVLSMRGLERGEKFAGTAQPLARAMAEKDSQFARRPDVQARGAAPQGGARELGVPRGVPEITSMRNTDALKAHPDYAAAKAGHPAAAVRVVTDLVQPEQIEAAQAIGPAVWVFPHAEEASGRNAIPAMLAARYASATGGTIDEEIVQANRVFHTGAPAMQRLIAPARFQGDVVPGARYVLVDDVTTMGGTLADLANHIRTGGGEVVGVVTLANASRTPTMTPTPQQIAEIQRRYGQTLRESLKVEPGALTSAEASYVLGFRDADSLRARAAKAEQERADRLRAKGLSPGQEGVAEDGGSGQFARGQDEPPIGGWQAPEATVTDRVIYELQDSRIDLKRVQEAIGKAGREIQQRFDARLAETLFPGRVARRAETFLNREAKPLLKAMARIGASLDEVGDYLLARHAPERNEQIAKVNPDLPDGGAGSNSKGELMTTQAARDYLDAIPPQRRALLEELATYVDRITAGTRDLLVAEGLEKRRTIDAWGAAYKHYVPLFKDEAEDGGAPHSQGQGFNVRGPASKRATGSTKEVTNVLAHVFMQREAAIARAEKNRVGLALYGLAMTHPNPDFWTTIKPGMPEGMITRELQRFGVDPMLARAGMSFAPTIRDVSDVTGEVVDRPNPLYKSLPGAIVLRLNGEDRVLMLNTQDPRAARLAADLKNLDGLTKLDLAGSIVGKSTRWLAAVNTQYNPAFGLANLTRDTWGGLVNLGSTQLRGRSLQVLSHVPAAMKGITQALATDERSRNDWAKLWVQFQDDGGRTGWRENFRDPNERAHAIEKALLDAERNGALSPKKLASSALGLLDGFNTVLENAVRLAAYKTALERGIARPEAARLARELTVDFNRKGRSTRELSPLYAFFNASVQGSARTVEALKGPTGKAIIAGGLTLGVIQALLLLMADYEDDEIPDFIQSRALIIPLPRDDKGGKRYVTVPYPLGLHVLPNTGRVLTQLGLSGGKDLGKRLVGAIGEIASAFNPLGGGDIFTAHGILTTAAPTLVDPIVDIGFNRNFAGLPIEREQRGERDTRPGYQRAREGTQRSLTGQAYIGISRILNKATGGTAYEAGKASPTPERLRYYAETVGGGVVRELEKAIDSSHKAAVGDKVKPNGVPIIGRFYGEVDVDQVTQKRYYQRGGSIDKVQNSMRAAKAAGDGEAMDRIAEENPVQAALIQSHDKVQRQLSKLNKLAATTVDDREMMRDVDAARVETMRGLNEAFEELERADRPPTPGERLKKALGREAVPVP